MKSKEGGRVSVVAYMQAWKDFELRGGMNMNDSVVSGGVLLYCGFGQKLELEKSEGRVGGIA